jgi:hypothetical protein
VRVNTDEHEYSYSGYDPGGFGSPTGGFLNRLRATNAANIRQHFGDSVSNGYTKLHDKIWSKLTLFTGVGFIALVAWLAAKVLKLAVPAKWTFLYGLLGVIETIGWWVLVICAGILILGWLVGAFAKFQDWLKSRI